MVRQTTTHIQRLDGTRLKGPVLGMSQHDADSSAPLSGRCVVFPRYVSLVLCSVSSPDLTQAFPQDIWAFRCTDCTDVFLNPCAGLRIWRESAANLVGHALYTAVSSLPEVRCKESAGKDSLGVPLGRCDRCYCREKRAKRASSGATSHLGCAAPPASAAQRSDARKSPEPDDQWTAANARPSAVANFTPSDLGCRVCLSAQARIEQLRSALGGATRRALRAQRAAGDLRIRLLTALTTTPPRSIPPTPSCPEFLEALRRGAVRDDQNGPALQAIAATNLLPGSPPELRLQWANGVECVYVRQRATTKPVVGRSQRYKRLASGLK